MYEYLLDNGMTREEYHWFRDNHVKAHCVMGNDYYITNEHLVHDDGTTSPAGEIFGYYVITRQYFSRYRLPVMHTETNIAGCRDAARTGCGKNGQTCCGSRRTACRIVGFTWYSLTDQVDWDTALREDNGHVNPCGLVDLERRVRPVGRAYKELIELWRGVMPMYSHSLGIG